MNSNVKKIAISLFVVAAFGLYVWHSKREDNTATVSIATNSSTGTSNTATGTSSTTATTSSTSYKDGTYTGSTADAYYGYIQVRATISGGKLTNVEFLQYPNSHRESVQINTQAMPLLKQEAIQSQTAQVDGVSGATLTSQAFIESLTNALNQAKA
jgi:uncharacterized protein with FMN-binding domain